MSSHSLMMKLVRAIFADDVETAGRLLDKYPELSFEGGRISPLWMAASKGHVKIVELLIKSGANVNELRSSEADNTGMQLYILHWLGFVTKTTCLDGHLKCAKILIEHGVDVNKHDNYYDDTPLALSMNWNNVKWAEFLLNNGAKVDNSEGYIDLMMESVFEKKTPDYRQKMLELLFDHGLNPGYRNEKGKNLLHLFIKKTKTRSDNATLEVAQMLVDRGVPIEGYDHKGFPPLFYAIIKENSRLAMFFIDKGVNVNRKITFRINSQTFPLFSAAACKNKKTVRALLSSGAEINAKTSSGETALHRACKFCSHEVIDFLIQKGADLSAEDENGKTPFSELFFWEDDFYDKCLRVMIKEFSRLVYEKIPLHNNDLNMILENPSSRNHFENCTVELELMKKTKFYEPYSYLFVYKMSKNLKKLANLTKNKKFIVSFKAKLNEFSYYDRDLRRILKQAVEAQKIFKTVYSRLYYTFRNFFPSVVLRNVAKYLTTRDLPMH